MARLALARALEKRLRCPHCREEVVLVVRVHEALLLVLGIFVVREGAPRAPINDDAELRRRARDFLALTTRVRLSADRAPTPSGGGTPPFQTGAVCPCCARNAIGQLRIDRALAKMVYEVGHARRPEALRRPAAVRVGEGVEFFGQLSEVSLRRPRPQEARA